MDEHSHFGPPNTPILDQDIVTRLQDQANAPALAWLRDAADEIERLRGREVLLRGVIDGQINEIAELQVLGDQLAQAFRTMGGLDVAHDAWLRAWEEARRG